MKKKNKPIVLILLAAALLFCTISSIVLLVTTSSAQENAPLQNTYYVFSIVTATLSAIFMLANVCLFYFINNRIIELTKYGQTGRLQILSEFSEGRIGFKIENHGMGSVQISDVDMFFDELKSGKKRIIDFLIDNLGNDVEGMYYADSLISRCISAKDGFFLFKYTGKNVYDMEKLNDVMSRMKIVIKYYPTIGDTNNVESVFIQYHAQKNFMSNYLRLDEQCIQCLEKVKSPEGIFTHSNEEKTFRHQLDTLIRKEYILLGVDGKYYLAK